MSFLNDRVSPEPLWLINEVETELTDSSSHEKDKDNFNNNEGTETFITNYRNTNECQEELDGIPEEQIYNTSDLFQNGKTSRPGSQSPKLLSWNAEDASSQVPKRYHTCDRLILLAVCVMSAASLVLTLLMLFGIVAPLNCACPGKTGSDTSTPGANYTELSKNVQDLKQNMSFLKETLVRAGLEEMRKKYEELKAEMTELKRKQLSAGTNKSISYSDKDNITALWQAIQLQTNKQEVKQLEQKERHSNDLASLEMLINSSRQDMMNNKDRQEHTKALLLAVWTEVNNTKLDLQEKINNISKMAGSIGSPGFNGSQSPPGPKGAGDFSSCQYQQVNGTSTGADESDAQIDEPSGSIIMAATCSTNYAQEYNLATAVLSQKRRYICNCKGSSIKFYPHGKPKTCYLHYWLCSKT